MGLAPEVFFRQRAAIAHTMRRRMGTAINSLHGERICAADARVVRCESLCHEHVEVEFTLPSFPDSLPGQFLQIACGDEPDERGATHEWRDGTFPTPRDRQWSEPTAYLRRPFSIADRWTGAGGAAHLTILSRAVGPGTAWLERLRADDALNITGPLGRGFALPERTDLPVVLVGGGVGVPPLLYLARALHARGWRDVTLIFGATTRALVPLRLGTLPPTDGEPSRCAQLPGDAPYPTIVSTDDGTLGLRGRATDALCSWRAQRGDAARAAVYACGPERMLEATARLTRQFGWDAQLCIEKPMGCGLGTCLSCVVRVHDAQRPAGWRWALACTEGPCFARDRLVDYDENRDAGDNRAG